MDLEPLEETKDFFEEFTLSKSFLIGGLVAVATVATRKGAERSWQALTKRPPPSTIHQEQVDIKEAVLWAVVVGAATGLARLAVKRAIHSQAPRLKP